MKFTEEYLYGSDNEGNAGFTLPVDYTLLVCNGNLPVILILPDVSRWDVGYQPDLDNRS